MRNTDNATHIGVFDVNGASCPSCAFAIERAGRRIAGVQDVRLDVNSHEIRISYDGRPEALAGIEAIVRRLGYHATLKSGGSETA
jgi:Cu+-exporting ATPase